MADRADEARIDRRTALKKAAIAGAALGAMWTAPKIEGLSLRPNYASAGSAGTPSVLTKQYEVAPNGRKRFTPRREDFVVGDVTGRFVMTRLTDKFADTFSYSFKLRPNDYTLLNMEPASRFNGVNTALNTFTGTVNSPTEPFTMEIEFLCT